MKLDDLCINAIRFLAVDAVEQAASGHPGAPMGLAAVAYTLWQKHLKHNPADPSWPDRDRFVLSAGHASALLYSLLHVYGYPLSIIDLKNFRQLGSKTPGHPEYDPDLGIETTTGPLGQGMGNAVGMAMAERWLASRYNRPGLEIIGHYTYVFASDGDMMEGVSSEAASMAGTLGLGKLICLYDDNRISIEGPTGISFTEDVAARFKAYGWQVIGPVDGMDVKSVDRSLLQARRNKKQPSLIVCRTCIGFGSPNKAGTAAAHGEPLGGKEVELTRQMLGWTYNPFEVPRRAIARFARAKQRGSEQQAKWQQVYEEYTQRFPDDARELSPSLNGTLPEGWNDGLDGLFDDAGRPMATRQASGLVLNAVGPKLPFLIGGSADLAPSTKTLIEQGGDYGRGEYGGRNVRFGVREHAMGAIASGMSLHGGIIPYTATFLVFYDYMRPPVRLAAMMGIRVIYIFTHDSIGLGQDGPTHQPVEQLMGLRLVPNLVTLRPADAAETLEAWKVALTRRIGPTALVLTRQKLPPIDRNKTAGADGTEKGGYVLWESDKDPELIIIATGSEVHLALEATEELEKRGVNARVVSMPSWELFEAQPAQYREYVLPERVEARMSIEAGRSVGWERYTGTRGINLSVDCFGHSAPEKDVYRCLGLTVENIVNQALKLIGRT